MGRKRKKRKQNTNNKNKTNKWIEHKKENNKQKKKERKKNKAINIYIYVYCPFVYGKQRCGLNALLPVCGRVVLQVARVGSAGYVRGGRVMLSEMKSFEVYFKSGVNSYKSVTSHA